VSRLLGRFGWERATKVLKPHIWAEAWTDDDLAEYANSPFLDAPSLFTGTSAQRLRRDSFPWRADPETTNGTKFDIMHVIGSIDWHDGERSLDLGRGKWVDAKALTNVLEGVRTR